MLLLQIGDTLNQAADTLQQAFPQNTVLAAEQKMNLFSLLMQGGWVMLPIALLLFLGIYIFFERYFTIRRPEEHTSELQSLMRISYAVFCLNKQTIHANHTPHTP